ncbi:MAG: NTP/NDP exchange transporter [Phycisphaerales bacterium]
MTDAPQQRSGESPQPPGETPPSQRENIIGLRRDEVLPAGLAVLMGFLLFSGYSVMKPLRDAANAAVADRFGEKAVAGLTTATLVAMALATLVVGTLVSLLGWRRFFALAQVVWLVGALTYAVLFRTLPSSAGGGLLAGAFIVSVNVFNLLSLSLMWSRLSDLFTPERAKRVYPLIALGLTLGNIAGSASVARFAKQVDASAWLFISAAALLGSMLAAFALLRTPDRPAAPGSDPLRQPTGIAAIAARAVEGLTLIARSPYLLGLALYLLLYSTTGTILWFEQQRIVRAAEVTTEARTAAFATIDLYTNIATLALQGLVAGRILGLIGVAAALTVTPLTTAAGISVLWAWPTLTAIIIVQVSRRALHYAIDRPAREALYTVVSPAERHKAKSFIDTFVYRFGDQCGAWLQAALGALSPAAVGGAIGACVVWGAVGIGLGRRFSVRSRPAAEQSGT